MAQIEVILRYNLIIKKLQRHEASFKEIDSYLNSESELQEYNFRISDRSFQRDIQAIRMLYGINIEFNRSKKVYYIESTEKSTFNERLLEAINIYQALNVQENLSSYIHFEQRKPLGVEYMSDFLKAIKNRVKIRFQYQKYWIEEISQREVNPLALKEFKNRWYVVAQDNNTTKVFPLDRISNVEITKIAFQQEFDVAKFYHNCFGIMAPNAPDPTEVILSFTVFQGRYIKSLPLHHTQEILIDNENELQVKLNVFITEDFVIELRSFGNELKILAPLSLQNQIKNGLESTLKKYQN